MYTALGSKRHVESWHCCYVVMVKHYAVLRQSCLSQSNIKKLDEQRAMSLYKHRWFCDEVKRDSRKANVINKNIFPKDGRVRLLQITYKEYGEWSYVLCHIEHLKRIFQDCHLVIENCMIFVYTSISEQLLFRIQTCSHKSRLFEAFSNLIWIYGNQSTYLIITSSDNKIYVFPKCADTRGLFAVLEVEKRNLLLSKLNVSLSDVLHLTPNRILAGNEYSKDMSERICCENNNKMKSVNISCEVSVCKQVNTNKILCRPKPCQQCMSNSRNRFMKNISRRKPPTQISLKRAKKVMPSRIELISRVCPLDGGYPEQASREQDVDGCSAFSFPNGVIIPVPSASGIEHRQQTYVQENNSSVSNGSNIHPAELTATSYFSGSLNFSQDSAAPEQQRQSRNHETSSSRERTNITSDVIFGGQRRPPRYLNYIDETTRRRSFDQWTHSLPSAEQLSTAGFFYTGDGDLVRCFQCGIGLRDFSESDNPLLEHARYSRDCEYLFDHIGPTGLNQLQETIRNQLTGQNDQILLQNQSGSSQMYPNSCRHPEYRTAEARFASFSRWPPTVMQRPADLVEAGFYYTGVEDHVRCFTCDGGLRKWDPEDDPWTEHCRWFSSCPFARQVKGDEYIRLVQASAELNDDEISAVGGSDLIRTMAQMMLRNPHLQAILKEHKQACLEMGFKEDDFNETVEELRNRGNVEPTLDDIVDTIGVVVENREAASRLKARQNETPVEQNKRLKSFLICMFCEENKVNALFLPCTHHRLCMDCAAVLDKCPVCDRIIREKIKTYMG